MSWEGRVCQGMVGYVSVGSGISSKSRAQGGGLRPDETESPNMGWNREGSPIGTATHVLHWLGARAGLARRLHYADSAPFYGSKSNLSFFCDCDNLHSAG